MKAGVRRRGVVVVVLVLVCAGVAWAGKVRLKVEDEEGRGLAGAKVRVFFGARRGQEQTEEEWGWTDGRGWYEAAGDVSNGVWVKVSKQGYKGLIGMLEREEQEGCVVATVRLERVRGTIARYLDKDIKQGVGFDLEYGDWVWPEGAGEVSDVVMRVRIETDSNAVGWARCEYEFEVEFPGEGNGIRRGEEWKIESPEYGIGGRWEAPEGGYERKLKWKWGQKEGEWYGDWQMGESNVWYFRVRTELDETGGVKRALYGVILGGIEVGGTARERWIRWAYAINVEENERELVVDPQQEPIEYIRSNIPM